MTGVSTLHYGTRESNQLLYQLMIREGIRMSPLPIELLLRQLAGSILLLSSSEFFTFLTFVWRASHLGGALF